MCHCPPPCCGSRSSAPGVPCRSGCCRHRRRPCCPWYACRDRCRRRGQWRSAAVRGAGMDGIMPAIVVICRGAIPAAVLVFERRVIPLVAGTLPAHHHALAFEPCCPPPHRRYHLRDIPLDGVCRLGPGHGSCPLALACARWGWRTHAPRRTGFPSPGSPFHCRAPRACWPPNMSGIAHPSA